VTVGCPLCWTDWISTILTKILVNGVPWSRICHGCGLRQGGPLSLMLFVLVLECFNTMIKLADVEGFLRPLWPSSIKQRVSLYADDVVVFLSLLELDLTMIREILVLFRRVTGLATNLSKSKTFLIHCSADQLGLITCTLACLCANFLCTHLRVPLSSWRLPKSAMQPIIDKVAKRMPPWKERMLNWSGRLILAQSTLCAIPVHISMATRIEP
jgi:hypothetical protein